MRRKLIPLLTVFALLLVAAGGATAAGDASTNISADETATDGDVGICLVGADSPCNEAANSDESSNGTTHIEPVSDNGTHPTPSDGPTETGQSDESQMWIPEDQNRDGEIDDRFRGDDSDATDEKIGNGTADEGDDAGICVVGADSPCTGAPTTHPTPMNDSTDIGTDSGQSDDEGQMWIPEDQNRDGEIDDRFTTVFGSLADITLPFLAAL